MSIVLSKTMYLILAVVAVVMLLLLARNLVNRDKCMTNLVGESDKILASLAKCNELCWYKHATNPLVAEDCFVISLKPTDRDISGKELETDEFVVSRIVSLKKDNLAQIKISYDPSIRKVVIKNV